MVSLQLTSRKAQQPAVPVNKTEITKTVQRRDAPPTTEQPNNSTENEEPNGTTSIAIKEETKNKPMSASTYTLPVVLSDGDRGEKS